VKLPVFLKFPAFVGGGGGLEEDEDDDEESGATTGPGSRAQYVSANCVVFTHYSGDVASVVDEHFSRALSYTENKSSSSASTQVKGKSVLRSCLATTLRSEQGRMWQLLRGKRATCGGLTNFIEINVIRSATADIQCL
jgi:hypothetical protein